MRGVVGINPQIVKVAVRAIADAHERLASISGAILRHVLHVHDILILGIRKQVRVVKRALPDVAIRIRERPRRTGVITLEQAAVFVLHHRVDAFGIRTRHRDTDATYHTSRQSWVARDLRPRFAAVNTLVQTTARTTARHLIFFAIRLPQRRVHHVGIRAINADINRAGIRILVQHFAPTFSTIRALVHPTLGTGHTVFAKRRDKHNVGIRWMNTDLGNRVRLGKCEMRPHLPGVGAFVDAIAWHDVAAQRRFAHADVHEIGIALTHRNCTD